MDKEIYLQNRDGTFFKVNEPSNPLASNFLILYCGLDWSGFRTLAGCEKQLPDLTDRGFNHYTIVERF